MVLIILCLVGVVWFAFAALFVFALVRAAKKQPSATEQTESEILKRAA
jgi:hypothetical protein